MRRIGFALALALAPVPLAAAPAPGLSPPGGADLLDLRVLLPVTGPPPFLLTLLVLLAGGSVLAWRLRRRARLAPDPPAEGAPETGDDPAQALGGLADWYRREGPPGELLCLRVDALLRSALELWTGLPAGRLTTDELLGRVSVPEGLWPGELALADQLLSFCDRVKFAGHAPRAEEVEWVLDAAGALLGRTVEGRDEVS
jgi:hypothetical protein